MFVVVTGASKGIGLEIVKQLLSDKDCAVLAISRSTTEIEKLRKNSGKRLFILKGDISKGTAQRQILAIVKKQSVQVDILINNAGLLVNKPFEKISPKELAAVYSVNVFAPFQLAQTILPYMGKKRRSHIINIGSIGGIQGSVKFPGLSAYSSSKAAVAGLTECLAEELREKNISCNCLALGAVQTEMLSKAFPGYKAPLSAEQMASFIVQFAITGHNFFNGKILPVSSTTP